MPAQPEAYVQLVGRDAGYGPACGLKSGEQRMVRAECMATVGAVSNPGPHANTNDLARPGAIALAGPSPGQFAVSP